MSGLGISQLAQDEGAMPWDAKGIQKHNGNATAAQAKAVAPQANAILEKTGDEGMALAIANKRIKRLRERGSISEKARGRRMSSGLDSDVDASSR